MGKDQDLLDASRCGNYAVVEKILAQRAKKTGPLASLRRGLGPDIQDNNGYTPLHHASLNGHKDIVELLLSHEASANIVDNKGCTPLHLAAWSGNTDVVKSLLAHGPSVNHMNFDHESALHSAAQYGHADIVKLLIEHNCYTSVRNVKNESPLDLASQYGRLETVQCLLNSNPNLLADIVRCHSPLHLAAKNGHKQVVKLLLDSGFDVNYMTDIGTALHEAAMYGKLEVVKLLLDYGIDPHLENSRQRTVFDILNDLNTSIAKQIYDIIQVHITLIKLDVVSDSLPFESCPQFNPECLSEITPPRQFCSPVHSIYDTPVHKREKSSSFPQDFPSNHQVDEIVPPPSFFTANYYSDNLQQQPVYQNIGDLQSGESTSWTFQDSYVLMSPPPPNCDNQLQPPTKPPRKFLSSELKNNGSHHNSYEFLCLSSSGQQNCNSKFLDQNKNNCDHVNYNKNYTPSEYIDMSIKEDKRPLFKIHDTCANKLDADSRRPGCNDFLSLRLSPNLSEVLPPPHSEDLHKNSYNSLMPSKSTPALHASRHTLDLGAQPAQLDIHRKQTLAHSSNSSPPSPSTAEIGIHEKIYPKNQNSHKKLPSEDKITLTDEQLIPTIGPSGEVELTLATDSKCISTDNEKLNPFAGLHYGSVSSKKNKILLSSDWIKNSGNKHLSNNKSKSVYENVEIMMEPAKSPSSGEVLSVMSPFDEKAEWAEIADIMATFSSAENGCIFTNSLKPSTVSACFSDLEQWLSYNGLSQYDNILILNGYDDIHFLGGNMLEDSDLQEIGIENAADRHKLIKAAAQQLPPMQPMTRNSDTFPHSVHDWLKSLNLSEYIDTFLNNNITDMDRVLKLWEVELNTVLKISKLGHRKRILASLGDKFTDNLLDSKLLDLSKLNLDLSELDVLESFNENPLSKDLSSLNVIIRSPNQLMKDSEQEAAHWRHHPQELIINSCNYMTKYLGSTLVKELQGLDSTKSSIQKLKKSTKDIAKIPNIILSISYSGVKFIDAQTQQLVCEHEIRNIHCACQDAEDLCFFAYITKEHHTHNHYCHVFSSHSMDMASEIILTLGQAFEVAYQMAMKGRNQGHSSSYNRTSYL